MASYRIGLIVDHFLPRLGGIELQVADLARRLAAAGHEATVLTTTPGDDDLDGLRVERLPAALLPRFQIPWNIAPQRRLREMLSAGRFDVIHIHASVVSPTAYGAIYWARRLGVPHLVTVHSLWRKTALLADWATRFGRRPRAPTIWSTVSHFNAARIAKRRRLGEVQIAPNGIDCDEWNVASRPHRGLRTAVVLRMNAKKRPEEMVRTIPRALAILPSTEEFRFTLIGDGPRRAAVERLIHRLDLGSHVELTGSLSRAAIRERFAETDVFAHPTRLEAFGIAVLEASAAGLPVVAMNGSGVTDLIQHERQGLLASDADEFAAAIARLLSDVELRRRCGAAGRETARLYNWSAVVPAHLELYRRAMAVAMVE